VRLKASPFQYPGYVHPASDKAAFRAQQEAWKASLKAQQEARKEAFRAQQEAWKVSLKAQRDAAEAQENARRAALKIQREAKMDQERERKEAEKAQRSVERTFQHARGKINARFGRFISQGVREAKELRRKGVPFGHAVRAIARAAARRGVEETGMGCPCDGR